jgi:hypothetical protein
MGCNKDMLEPTNEDFNVKAFISNIKSYNINADYVETVIPTDTTSSEMPYLSLQSWVIKGKDILMSITVPDDAEELYFGAVNSEAEYLGLDFKGHDQKTAIGYYRLELKNLTKSGTVSNGLTNYQVVLSSNEDIQLDKFDMIASYKTANGISNKTSVPMDVKSIDPYQKTLKVGFRPLSGYTYTINITTPTGGNITYSYNKGAGTETFNSQSPDATLSYDSDLDFKWINFSDPQFGGYTMTATIQIDISGDSQYIYLLMAIVSEGKIDQLDLDADIQQTGQNTAVGIVNVGFSYFSQFEDKLPSIKILKARMTSSHTLGVDVEVSFPKNDIGPRYVELSATINGTPVVERFDVTRLVGAGETALIEWVYSNPKLQIDFSNAKGLNGELVTVPKFRETQKFDISAKAISQKIGESLSSPFKVTIVIPTLIIHGVSTNLFEELLTFIPYVGLQTFLVDNGYETDDSWYKTLWGPPELKYSSQEDTPEEIAGMLTDKINKAINATYAEKVNLIGHSLGGMIGRYYITEYDHGFRVNKLIMVGTPNKGSTQFYTKLYSMSSQDADLKLKTSDGKLNCRNWLSPAYNSIYNKNTGLLIANTYPNLFHAGQYDKPAPTGVKYYSIYNNSLSTIRTVFVSASNDNWYKNVEEKENGFGDGTVLLESSSTYGINIGVNTLTTHAFLPSDNQVMSTILSSLNSSK